MIAEIYGLMRDDPGMKAPEMVEVFANWNKGKLNSYRIESTAKVWTTVKTTKKKPLVDSILECAQQKGTGK